MIDDLARFRRAILGGGAQLTELSHGCVDPTSPNLAEAQGDHRSIALALLFQSSDILLLFQTRVVQS